MTNDKSQRMERLHELLTDLELGLLDDAERAELDALTREIEAEDASFDVEAELAAVAEDLALTHAALAHGRQPIEPLPQHLHDRLVTEAGRHFGWSPSALEPSPRASAPAPVHRPSFGARLGWVAAAAAAVALVVVLTRPDDAAEPESFEGFVARADDEIVVDWDATQPLGEGVTGAVAWSASEQTGVMRFDGLEPNDPSVSQYQLWIIDAERPGEDPVDGGVFDVASSGRVEVPIDAKLAVGSPAVFAVTVEKPGGVVVSDQSQLFLAAAVEG